MDKHISLQRGFFWGSLVSATDSCEVFANSLGAIYSKGFHKTYRRNVENHKTGTPKNNNMEHLCNRIKHLPLLPQSVSGELALAMATNPSVVESQSLMEFIGIYL